MKNQDLEKRISELLHRKMSPGEKEEALSVLENLGMNREEAESLIRVSDLIADSSVPEPSEQMDKRFYALLEEERGKSPREEPEIGKFRHYLLSWLTPGLRIAAGIALFLLGWFAAIWFGNTADKNQMAELTGELKQLKETLALTMIRQNTTVERIKAVNMISELEQPGSSLIECLFGVLNTDSNDNVRLLALDALTRYGSVPSVRDGLVASIADQTSPLVQLRLAEVMLALNERRAVPEFQKLLKNSSLNYSVRDKMNEALGILL